MHSAYGTLYSKQDRKGKVSEYISRWHENEKKVRVIFSDLYELIKNNGCIRIVFSMLNVKIIEFLVIQYNSLNNFIIQRKNGRFS